MPRTTQCQCPNCNQIFTAATNLDDEDLMPVPGDISVCIHCAQILTLLDDLTVRIYTWEEVRALPIEVREPTLRYHAAVKARLAENADAG